MDSLASALVAAQKELANPPKTSTARVPTKSGGTYTYSYAPLPEILDAVRPILHRHGLAVMQHVVGEAGSVGVITELVCVNGERFTAGPVMLPATDPQQAGGIITYLRRYSLCALLGIAADEDTDAKTSPAPGPAGTAGAGTTEPHPTAAPQAGDHQSPPANGEVTAATEPGGGVLSTSPGSTILGPDQPGPPHYPLRPDECDHRNEKSGHLLRPRKSPRGPVCPRCGLSYITVTESTTADLGSA